MAVGVLAGTLLLVVGCSGDDGKKKGAGSSPPAKPGAPADTVKVLPDLTGEGLMVAQEKAKQAGFSNFTSHDVTGAGRQQVWDRNWKVCDQTPESGPVPTQTKVDFGAVKTEENCPAGTGVSTSVGDPMPALTGKNANDARLLLPAGTDLRSEDGSGRDRVVLLLENWKVCAQDPEPGASLKAARVTLTVMKAEENCP